MKTNFRKALDFTLKFEGLWSDHPRDPGGATMKGITLAVFREWVPGGTKAQLRNISDDLVERIYRRGYWQPINADVLASGVDACAFDYAVNSGVGRARKALKAVEGLPAAKAVRKMCASRLSFLRALRTWSTFGKGWARRVTSLEAFCLSIAGANMQQEIAAADTKKKTAATVSVGAVGGGVSTPVVAVQDDSLLPWSWPVGILIATLVVIAIASAWHAYVNAKRQQALLAETTGAQNVG